MTRTFLILALLINALTAWANNDRKISLTGMVYDATFRSQLPGAKLYLMDSVGAVIDSTKAGLTSIKVNGEWKQNSDYSFEVSAVPAKYTLEANYPGHEPEFLTVVIEKTGSRMLRKELPDILLRKEFKEVVVSATKVKFYNKGDTLIYNADAFMLAEGSMLDALIRQLPGVELKDDGRIFVNGKYVESLLLNGKQFIGADNRLLLDNLGAYMIKDVAVYDKLGDKSQFMGRDTGDKEYVMDVRMKKEFMGSYTINTEVGYGTENRYLGRLFMLRYDSSSQYMIYGNINNLNDNLSPGQNNSWDPSKMQSGLHREKLLGGQYEISGTSGTTWKVKGNLIARHSSEDDEVYTTRTNFLPGGNTYGYSFNNIRNRGLNLSTYHYGNREFKHLYLSGEIRANYNRLANRRNAISGVFNSMQDSVNRRWLDDIYSTESSASLSSIINRVQQYDSLRNDRWSAYASGIATYKFSQNNDAVTLWLKAQYAGDTPTRYNERNINFGSSPVGDRIIQLYKNFPNKEFYIKPYLDYLYYFTGGGYIQPIYTFTYTRRHNDSRLFETLSLEEPLTLNVANSTFAINTEIRNTLGFRSTRSFSLHNGYFRLMLGPTFGIANQTLNFNQAGQSIRKSRRSLYYNDSWTELTYAFGEYSAPWGGKTYRNKLILKFTASETLPDMKNLVDIPNTADPLTILEGAPELKNQHDFKWNLRYELRPSKSRIQESTDIYYRLLTNALVRGYSYDSSTGIRRIRSYNTSGNWETGTSNSLSLPLDKKRRFTLSSNSSIRYGCATDVIGRDEMPPTPFSVNNLFAGEKINLSWNAAQWINLTGKAEVEYRHTSSEQDDFSTINAFSGNYGVIATMKFFKKLSVSTDLTLYTRNGYGMPGIDTSDLVWNARVAYSINRGRWNIMLDGFDLLHRLKSIQYSVNAQGRTVTYLNSLPRFFMLHIQYRIDIKKRH